MEMQQTEVELEFDEIPERYLEAASKFVASS